MRAIVSLFVAFLFIDISSAGAQPESIRIDSLTLDLAVSIGLEHHPTLQAAQAGVRVAEAGLKQARSNFFPSLSFSAAASHTEGVFVFNPSVPSRNQIYSNYTGGFAASQIIYDFGKTTGRVSASSDLVDASTFDEQSTRGNVIVNVQLAYIGYLAARRVVKVNQEAVDQATKHLVQAKAFYAVGRRPQFDVTKAEVDLANANVNLIRARNAVTVARVTLENAMGIHSANEYPVSDSLNILTSTLSMDSAKAIALMQRQEILAARSRVTANEDLVSAAWGQHLPTVSATGSWTWSTFEVPPPAYGRWSAGFTFALPIFQGFALDAQVQQAKANTEAAKANLETLIESVTLEVEQTYLSLKEAQERIGASTKLVAQAEENLNLAERQYSAGVGTPLDVTDAQVTRSNAQITYIQAVYDYNSSIVRLSRAVGLTGR